MIITSTSSLEGYKIEEYLDIIIINKAINIVDFSEWLIGIQNSGAALSSMERLKNEVIKALIETANEKKANAILGFSMDYDQIGGKSGGMLMVSAIGTPVKINKLENQVDIFNLARKYLLEVDEKNKLLFELELRKYNVDSELQKKILIFVQNTISEEEEKEKTKISEFIEKNKEEIEKRKFLESMGLEKEKKELEKYPIRKDLIQKQVRYIECSKCLCKNYTSNITSMNCNQCGENLENGKMYFY